MSEYEQLLEKLLTDRGINGDEQRSRFLSPDYSRDLYDPLLLPNVAKGVDRLLKAIENNEKIVVFADYDCDGIPGAVIFRDLFKQLGFENFQIYIPHRHLEGYGLGTEPLEGFAKEGVNLVITVDLGITAIEEAKLAKDLGLDLIITDHHLPATKNEKEVLPNCCAVVSPCIKDSKYPNTQLSGAGVAFTFVRAFAHIAKEKGLYKKELFEGFEKWMLDMVALSIVSDMVSLLGENRALTYFGLQVLRKSKRPGFIKLLKKSGCDQKQVSEDDLGFVVVPRLNAASRLSHPMKAFDLLIADDQAVAEKLASELTSINNKRKTLVATTVKEIKKKIENRQDREVIVVGDPSWNIGVLGLIASYVAGEYKKPAFVWSVDERQVVKGSCRSDGSVDLVAMMEKTQIGVFSNFGGHSFAGGFSVAKNEIHFLEEKLVEAFKQTPEQQVDEVQDFAYDTRLLLSDVNMENFKLLNKLSPFGIDNPKPVFLFPGLHILQKKTFGKSDEHLELVLMDEFGSRRKAISFFAAKDMLNLSKGDKIDITATFDHSNFAGRSILRLRLIDYKLLNYEV